MLSISLCFSEDGIQFVVVTENGFMYTTKCDSMRSVMSELSEVIRPFDDLYEY